MPLVKAVRPVQTMRSPNPVPYAPVACPRQLSTRSKNSLNGPLTTFPIPRPNAMTENTIVASDLVSTFWTSRIIPDQVAEKLPAKIPYATENTNKTAMLVENPHSKKIEITVPIVEIMMHIKA
jgi:hypothetical protein